MMLGKHTSNDNPHTTKVSRQREGNSANLRVKDIILRVLMASSNSCFA